MARKTYNPYKVKVHKINRFRGIVNPENELTIAKPYVGSANNMESFRIGEMVTRVGQISESIRDD